MIYVDERISLDQILSIPQQIEAFNENYFGDVKDMFDDFQSRFSLGIEEVESENERCGGTQWNSLVGLFSAEISHLIDLGYIPWKVNFLYMNDKIVETELLCQDRRIERHTTGLGMP